MITGAQLALLLLAVVAFVTGGIASLVQRLGYKIPPSLRWLTFLAGIALASALLIWHSNTNTAANTVWQPLQDNLSALLTLAIVLASFVAYVQWHRPIPLLEWLVMPVVIALLLMAGHFGKARPESYLPTTYSLVHRLSSFLGAIAFVVAGATGVLYLLSDHALRRRDARGGAMPPSGGMFGSLERLEHLTHSAVTLGFALFTVGIITGITWIVHAHGQTRLGTTWYLSPKVLLTFCAWGVFGVVLNSPIAPRLRGRRAAWLSIIGVALTMLTLIAVLLMPSSVPAAADGQATDQATEVSK